MGIHIKIKSTLFYGSKCIDTKLIITLVNTSSKVLPIQLHKATGPISRLSPTRKRKIKESPAMKKPYIGNCASCNNLPIDQYK